MDRRTVLSAIAVAASSTLFAGCAQEWIIHSHASPDPFRNQKEFAVMPIAFADLRVGEKNQSEAGYLADKSPTEAQAFYADEAALNVEYLRSLTEAAREIGIHIAPAASQQTAAFLIQPSVTSIDPGQGAKWPSAVRMLVRVGTMDGKVFDTVEIRNRSSAYSPEARLRNDGLELGKTTVEYLKTRVMSGG
jgi:hypothetical protein